MISPILQPTYDDIHEACEQYHAHCQRYGYQPSAIMGVARGGLIPGVIFSHLFGVPLIPVSYSSKSGNGDDINHDNNLPEIVHSDVLLVDDIHDSGQTMTEIKEHYEQQGISVVQWAMHYKERTGKTAKVDGYWCIVPEDAGWVIYPFEEGGASK